MGDDFDRRAAPAPGGDLTTTDENLPPLLAAALDYAARGWPVFPCSPETKRPLLARDKDASGKPIKGSGGVSKASTDAAQISAWWRKWPRAMIGLATGADRIFVLDFDPRTDAETGEVWTLERLKGELEAQMGASVPSSLTGITQSGGVHVWLRWPDDGGPPITNRGNLPQHVDVRGKGGYIIVPPSRMASGRTYRWLRGAGPDVAPIADAPSGLVEILRSGAQASPAAPERRGRMDGPPPPRRAFGGSAVSDAQRRWALAALDAECVELAATPVGGGRHGGRNEGTFHAAFALGQIVAAGALSESMVRAALLDAIKGFGSDHSEAVENGLARGQEKPRDLSQIGQRGGSGGGAGAGAASGRHDYSAYDAGRDAVPPGAHASARQDDTARRRLPPALHPSFRSGTVEPIDTLSEREQARVRAVARDWLARAAARMFDAEASVRERAAWGIGRRCAAALFDVPAPSRWPRVIGAGEEAAWAALDASFDAGHRKGYDIAPLLLDLRCAAFPLTDFGIGERFHARHGDRFRFTNAKGWLGWDGTRWKVLDQDKDGPPPAEVQAAIFDTVRDIQREGRTVAATGDGPDGMDFAYFKGKKLCWHHEDIRQFGRQSETAGRPPAIAKLAQRWLTVPIEQFDCDPFAINVLNGTLRFRREPTGATGPGEPKWRASVSLEPHAREDLNTRLAPVEYDPDALCPIYDAFFEWAQPKSEVRSYLHAVAGYAFTGDTGEQKLWFHYGLGANGKSTWMDLLAHIMGDYSGTIGIETFLDQGIKKRGDAASPDLARLGGVRFLRASEPERGAKLNEALIKAATGGEPMAVRALHRGFFDLRPLFKLHIGGNYKPDIPGTDEGIWRRMKLVPWEQHRAEGERDEQLGEKLRGEAAGVLRVLIEGLLDWMEAGLIEPLAVKEATAAYREDSDPLARFLSLCTEPDPQSRVQASRLHEVFCAWCKAAGEREWSIKGLGKAMKDKGWSNKASNGMQWLGLKLVRDVGDFVDGEGKVREDGAGLAAPGDGPPAQPPPLDADFVPWDD